MRHKSVEVMCMLRNNLTEDTVDNIAGYFEFNCVDGWYDEFTAKAIPATEDAIETIALLLADDDFNLYENNGNVGNC